MAEDNNILSTNTNTSIPHKRNTSYADEEEEPSIKSTPPNISNNNKNEVTNVVRARTHDEDHANEAAITIPVRFSSSGRKKAVSFPVKLMKVLSMKEYENIIQWSPDGKAFLISDRKKFTNEVLPVHFQHANSSAKFESFMRKLLRWGFTYKKPYYTHDMFQRGNMRLVEQMSCRGGGGSGSSNIGTSIPPLAATAAETTKTKHNEHSRNERDESTFKKVENMEQPGKSLTDEDRITLDALAKMEQSDVDDGKFEAIIDEEIRPPSTNFLPLTKNQITKGFLGGSTAANPIPQHGSYPQHPEPRRDFYLQDPPQQHHRFPYANHYYGQHRRHLQQHHTHGQQFTEQTQHNHQSEQLLPLQPTSMFSHSPNSLSQEQTFQQLQSNRQGNFHKHVEPYPITLDIPVQKRSSQVPYHQFNSNSNAAEASAEQIETVNSLSQEQVSTNVAEYNEIEALKSLQQVEDELTRVSQLLREEKRKLLSDARFNRRHESILTNMGLDPHRQCNTSTESNYNTSTTSHLSRPARDTGTRVQRATSLGHGTYQEENIVDSLILRFNSSSRQAMHNRSMSLPTPQETNATTSTTTNNNSGLFSDDMNDLFVSPLPPTHSSPRMTANSTTASSAALAEASSLANTTPPELNANRRRQDLCNLRNRLREEFINQEEDEEDSVKLPSFGGGV